MARGLLKDRRSSSLRRFRATGVPAGALLVLLSTSTTYPARQDEGHKRTDKLIERAKSTVKAVDEMRKQVKKTLEAYDKMMKKRGKDRRSAYKDVYKELDRCESRAGDLHKRMKDMDSEANKFFAEWTRSLEGIGSDDLRQRSEVRLDDARDRYSGVTEAGRQATDELEPLFAYLRDQLAFLEYDLNSDSTESLQGDAERLDQQAARLLEKMGGLKEAANDYIGSLKP